MLITWIDNIILEPKKIHNAIKVQQIQMYAVHIHLYYMLYLNKNLSFWPKKQNRLALCAIYCLLEKVPLWVNDLLQSYSFRIGSKHRKCNVMDCKFMIKHAVIMIYVVK